MGSSRPTPPRNEASTTLPKVDDPLLDRHLAALGERIRQLEVAPSSPTCDGRRGMAIGGDRVGDLYYRARDGSLARLAAGTPGQTLTVGPDGLPRWS